MRHVSFSREIPSWSYMTIPNLKCINFPDVFLITQTFSKMEVEHQLTNKQKLARSHAKACICTFLTCLCQTDPASLMSPKLCGINNCCLLDFKSELSLFLYFFTWDLKYCCQKLTDDSLVVEKRQSLNWCATSWCNVKVITVTDFTSISIRTLCDHTSV